MTKQPPTHALIGAALALGLGSGMAAAETATGTMLANTCAGCHGTYGNSQGPATPTISAMDPVVFVETMQYFRDDETYSTIMGRIARGYSDEELEKMAEYFHQQEFAPAKQDFDQALVDKGADLHEQYCEKCHIEGGKPVPEEEDYYILAGQWTPYLKYAMSDFRDGRRELTKKMKSKLESMLESNGEDGLAALWAYYASQQ
ncbi:c-type cytochrome [Thiorhodovibrio frisius]|uniref:Cytochrome c553 n=1 Tax=Thiorhodovibrio frisius TaxID=631362 RepID=H8YZK1_9GAMM|nr:sulfide dehydrogenase [Thiorhodovibrio frisius]EIC22128.1 cytochrome c553 [Thiorhodovibrio frisius]WPL24421.1 Flavocytochrome c cytochrome subunit [Thiorhodovibrio frisius]